MGRPKKIRIRSGEAKDSASSMEPTARVGQLAQIFLPLLPLVLRALWIHLQVRIIGQSK